MKNQQLPDLGFHHIALRCRDIEKSLTMYKALGMTEVARWGEGNGLIVMLNIGDGGRIELFANGSDEYHENGKWQHFALCTQDVDGAYALALKAGFLPHIEPKTVPLNSTPAPMSIHIAFVKGPDNEQLEFFCEV
ncbi:MAG: VOC family protein [Ruminococcaceae bacterium]|nr:VOC family protein [Oscillospiraceae bacterium]